MKEVLITGGFAIGVMILVLGFLGIRTWLKGEPFRGGCRAGALPSREGSQGSACPVCGSEDGSCAVPNQRS